MQYFLKEKSEKNSEEKTGLHSEIVLNALPEGTRKIENGHRGRRLREGKLRSFLWLKSDDFVVRSIQNLRTKFLGQMGWFFQDKHILCQ
jgi:hypothetical protein